MLLSFLLIVFVVVLISPIFNCFRLPKMILIVLLQKLMGLMAFHFVWTVLCNFACMCNCSLSRLHSGACAVPYPQVIQCHGIGSSESL